MDAARQEESCAPAAEKQTAAVTAKEASILAWVATYDCFSPHPEFVSFTTRVEDPRRWVVEGRTIPAEDEEEAAADPDFYGLWIVDTETGEVSGLDNLAIAQVDNVCFKPLR